MPREARSFEEDVARAVEEWLHATMPAVADKLGPLPDSVIPTRAELIERWNLRAPQVQPGQEAMLAQQALQVIQEEHANQGKPLPDPDTMVKLVAARTSAALYPHREKVYSTGNPRPEQRVKVARQYARLVGAGVQGPLSEAERASQAVASEPAPATPPPPHPAPLTEGY